MTLELILLTALLLTKFIGMENPANAAILTDETYVPGACTPLYDAVGRTLTKIEKERHGHEVWSHKLDAYNRATPCATREERVCFNAELADEYYEEGPKKG